MQMKFGSIQKIDEKQEQWMQQNRHMNRMLAADFLCLFADIVIAIVGEERADDVRQWVRTFQKKNAWRMLSDEDDLALVLRRITVMPDRKLKMRWLDGKQTTCLLPKYYPTKVIEDYDDK